MTHEKPVQVFVYYRHCMMIIGLVPTAIFPTIVTEGHETVFQAAVRIGETVQSVDTIDIGQNWNFQEVLVALACAGLTFKPDVLAHKAREISDVHLLENFQGIKSAEDFCAFIRHLLNGGAEVRLEPVPTPAMRQGGAEELDGEPAFV